MTDAKARNFGRYDLLDLLAVGGMAEVFLARTRVGGITRTCVIKRVLPEYSQDRQFVSMFIDEARITVGLEHPNIVRLLDFGQVEGAYFMAIEYVDGVDLVDVLRAASNRGLGLPFAAAAWVAASCARGLHAAHHARDHRGRAMGIVHRDVSPHNVFIGWDGAVKIGDFGIAAARNKLSRTSPGTVMGKFGYMSPEQANGDIVDCRTDVWAMGVVLWEMLVGRRLFATDSPVETVGRVLALEVPSPSSQRPGIPPELDAICLDALRRPLALRLPSAEALADRLDAFVADDGAAAFAATLAGFGLAREGVGRRSPQRGRPAANPARSATTSNPSASPSSALQAPTRTRSIPPPTDPELVRLQGLLARRPSLELLVDLGERFAALGLRGEALSAIRTAAYLFAHRGLLVQAVCSIHAARGLVDAAMFDAELQRIAVLRGKAADELMYAMSRVEHHDFWDAVRAAEPSASVADEATFVAPEAPLLGMLAPGEFVNLARMARIERWSAGANIVLEGERGDILYAIGRGRVVVHTRRFPGSREADDGARSYLGALGEGDFFGEFSFLTKSPRAATVEAASDVVLLRLDRDVVDRLVASEAAFREHLVLFYKERVAELVLAKNAIIGALPADLRRALIASSEVRRYGDGEAIVREGDDADEIFVLLAGEAEVARDAGGFPVFINKLTEGQLFGEMAALGRTPRTATVRAMGDVEVLGVKRAAIEQALQGAEDVRRLLEATIQVRAAETEAALRETARIIDAI
jgi:serine/threonine protein kinase/CRP-like cAMP-binding protein